MVLIETKPLLNREEDEETLSLCDLAVNSTDEYCSTKHNRHDHDDDMFEFAGKNFTSSTYSNQSNKVVFCGKMISYRGGEENKIEKKRELSSSSSSSKLRWYLITFGSFGRGMKGCSGKMDMRDLRRRQSRPREVAPPPPPASDGRDKRSGRTLWRLIAILGCNSQS